MITSSSQIASILRLHLGISAAAHGVSRRHRPPHGFDGALTVRPALRCVGQGVEAGEPNCPPKGWGEADHNTTRSTWLVRSNCCENVEALILISAGKPRGAAPRSHYSFERRATSGGLPPNGAGSMNSVSRSPAFRRSWPSQRLSKNQLHLRLVSWLRKPWLRDMGCSEGRSSFTTRRTRDGSHICNARS